MESVLQGFNGAVLAYGQTSSGKTFTMEGPVGIGDAGQLLSGSTGVTNIQYFYYFPYVMKGEPKQPRKVSASFLEWYQRYFVILKMLTNILNSS